MYWWVLTDRPAQSVLFSERNLQLSDRKEGPYAHERKNYEKKIENIYGPTPECTSTDSDQCDLYLWSGEGSGRHARESSSRAGRSRGNSTAGSHICVCVVGDEL